MEDDSNFAQLEHDLVAALEEDRRYARENEVKLSAISQVSTYEEFKELVKASHLRPLDKSEKLNASLNTIWNSWGARKRPTATGFSNGDQQVQNHVHHQQQCTGVKKPQQALADDGTNLEAVPTNAQEFTSAWKECEVPERLNLLKKVGPKGLKIIFNVDIPVWLFGEIIQALLPFGPTTADVIFVVSILEALTTSKLFSVNVAFLSRVEKETCAQLLEKIVSSLPGRQQDLADVGITEWTVQELRAKFELP